MYFSHSFTCNFVSKVKIMVKTLLSYLSHNLLFIPVEAHSDSLSSPSNEFTKVSRLFDKSY